MADNAYIVLLLILCFSAGPNLDERSVQAGIYIGGALCAHDYKYLSFRETLVSPSAQASLKTATLVNM